MPNDVWYGADCELRVGAMADKDTDPTAWFNLEFVSLTVAPQRERRDRPKLGSPRNNALDPTKPIPGFLRVTGDLVVMADTRQLPRWLKLGLGAPTTTGASAPYTHVFSSGSKSPVYFALQVRTGTGKVHVFRGLTIAAISASGGGEQTQDFNVQLSLRGLRRARLADWLTGAVTAVPDAAEALRAQFRSDGVMATNTLQSAWSWDRQLAEDVFMSLTPEVDGLRPNGGALSGNARFRAMGDAFDDLEANDTVFTPALAMNGVISGHSILFEHPKAQLNAAPIEIPGPGVLERVFSWFGFQDPTTPGARITIVTDISGANL